MKSIIQTPLYTNNRQVAAIQVLGGIKLNILCDQCESDAIEVLSRNTINPTRIGNLNHHARIAQCTIIAEGQAKQAQECAALIIKQYNITH